MMVVLLVEDNTSEEMLAMRAIEKANIPADPWGTPGSAAQVRSPAGPPAPRAPQTGTAPAHAGTTPLLPFRKEEIRAVPC